MNNVNFFYFAFYICFMYVYNNIYLVFTLYGVLLFVTACKNNQ